MRDAPNRQRWRCCLDSRHGAIFLFGRFGMVVTRRKLLKTTGVAALLAGVPGGWAGGVYASDGPETPKVRIGIIAMTDCSSIVMAHELGLFENYGIESTISKEASWAAHGCAAASSRSPSRPVAAARPSPVRSAGG